MLKVYVSPENKENDVLTDHEKLSRIRELRKMITGKQKVDGQGYLLFKKFYQAQRQSQVLVQTTCIWSGGWIVETGMSMQRIDVVSNIIISGWVRHLGKGGSKLWM